jgi:hypothetical protein
MNPIQSDTILEELTSSKTFDICVTVHHRYYIRKNQLDATKCWFINSTGFEHYYAHLQESGHFHHAAHTTNSSALHNPDGLHVWTPESGTH